MPSFGTSSDLTRFGYPQTDLASYYDGALTVAPSTSDTTGLSGTEKIKYKNRINTRCVELTRSVLFIYFLGGIFPQFSHGRNVYFRHI